MSTLPARTNRGQIDPLELAQREFDGLLGRFLGGRENNDKAPEGEHLLRERRYTRFLRSFTLPPTVNESSVKANLENGVLHITLDKREETKPRKIKVS